MAIIQRIVTYLTEITKNIDEELEKGYDLTKWGDQMKYLHALQIQAQALLDLAQRIASLTGRAPRTYIDAGKVLLREGILREDEYKLYKAIVGFRNILVHEYVKVNMQLIDEILKKRKYRNVLKLALTIMQRAKEKGLHDP